MPHTPRPISFERIYLNGWIYTCLIRQSVQPDEWIEVVW